uniref:Uncharacterized protein n=1 Tax=Globodera rostochiensis TaxID=31243 RepID=A0A914H0F2_GLORO
MATSPPNNQNFVQIPPPFFYYAATPTAPFGEVQMYHSPFQYTNQQHHHQQQQQHHHQQQQQQQQQQLQLNNAMLPDQSESVEEENSAVKAVTKSNKRALFAPGQVAKLEQSFKGMRFRFQVLAVSTIPSFGG